jgi:hypothetical protein
MPGMSRETKIEIFVRRKKFGESIRSIAGSVGIPKSTLHNNLSNIENFISEQKKKESWPPLKQLLDKILIYIMDGNMSVRNTSKVLKESDGYSICPATIGAILTACSHIARKQTTNIDLSNIKSALFDEIFQKKEPILGFVDPLSGLTVLSGAKTRSKKVWSGFLNKLKNKGLMPESTVTDGASGLLGGISKVWSEAVKIRDFFHFMRILVRATGRIEGYCYSMIVEVDLLKSKGLNKNIAKEEKHLAGCIAMYDMIYDLKNRIRNAFYIRCETGIRQYISAFELARLLSVMKFLLTRFNDHYKEIRSVKDAATYIKRGFTELTAYKRLLEKKVREAFGKQNSHAALEYFMKMAEYLDHFHRSYEDNKSRDKWATKIARLRTSIRKFGFVCQEEVDKAINIAAGIYKEVFKSNSLIESVNSVIRVHLKTYKSIPSWFCDLFSYYWNNRIFTRGKRKALSPLSMYTGDDQPSDWRTEILERFPYDEFRKYFPENREDLAA